MSYHSEILLTANELVLWQDRFGIVNDVAFVVEFTGKHDWKIDRVGFVDKYGKFGNHEVAWINSGDPLETLLARKLTSEWSEYIEDRISVEMDHWERHPSRYREVA